jgi:probable addiction module antidote protein
MKRQYRTYQESLYEGLQDPQEAIAYLNAALIDEDQRVFLLALKDVLSAQHVDISVFAQESQLTRQSIYRMLSSSGNPGWDNLWSLINAMGLQVQLTSKNRK